VNVASLPYTVLILLLELAVGSLAMVTVFDARRQVTRGYVKTAGVVVVPITLLATWLIFALAPGDEVDGYRFREGWLPAVRAFVVVFLVLAVGHFAASLTERRRAAIAAGAAATGAGTAMLAALAGLLGAPVWSTAGMFASLLGGTAVLGGANMAMMWGHWYLTSGRLPKEPMEQMSLVVLGAILLQALVVVLGVLLPPRAVPLSEGFGVGLGQNPAFWLRVGVGLVFPALLAVLAWRAAQIRGMMSATGLLYIALGAVLAGEVLARGLLFSTGLLV
jgi:hypothetical protein